jgi:hypothetical protein
MFHQREHHNIIQNILDCFDEEFLEKNNILFGGGTRISLELNEYRESIDIDFLCSTNDSYKAVREQSTNISLGNLLKHPVEFAKEIRLNRDAVRTVIKQGDHNVKLEFVNCNGYNLTKQNISPFNVPMIDHDGCFITKLLAHSDRKYSPDRKDLFDILMMTKQWGGIGDEVWASCERIYGKAPRNDLIEMLLKVYSDNNFQNQLSQAGGNLSIAPVLIEELIRFQSLKVLNDIDSSGKSSVLINDI